VVDAVKDVSGFVKAVAGLVAVILPLVVFFRPGCTPQPPQDRGTGEIGKPQVINRPDRIRFGGTGAVIACNHVGWADSLWMAYAVYPRQLRYMSKEELFGSTLSRWVLTPRRLPSD